MLLLEHRVCFGKKSESATASASKGRVLAVIIGVASRAKENQMADSDYAVAPCKGACIVRDISAG